MNIRLIIWQYACTELQETIMRHVWSTNSDLWQREMVYWFSCYIFQCWHTTPQQWVFSLSIEVVSSGVGMTAQILLAWCSFKSLLLSLIRDAEILRLGNFENCGRHFSMIWNPAVHSSLRGFELRKQRVDIIRLSTGVLNIDFSAHTIDPYNEGDTSLPSHPWTMTYPFVLQFKHGVIARGRRVCPPLYKHSLNWRHLWHTCCDL